MFAQKKRGCAFATFLLSDPVHRFSPCGLPTFLKRTMFIVLKGYGVKESSQFGNPPVQVIVFLHSTQPRKYWTATRALKGCSSVRVDDDSLRWRLLLGRLRRWAGSMSNRVALRAKLKRSRAVSVDWALDRRERLAHTEKQPCV